jgi:putative membrane protein
MPRITPLGALARGLIAGAAGSYAQDVFFKATARGAPRPPEGVFKPPEAKQQGELATVTLARRLSEGVLQRPLADDAKGRAAAAVHYGFGSAWGGLYGLARESRPEALSGTAWMVGFSALVWTVGDNLMLPALKLSAWPQAYPAKTHAYALAAHLAYGLGVWAAYEALLRSSWLTSAVELVLRRRLAARVIDKAKLLKKPMGFLFRRRAARDPMKAVRRYVVHLRG